MGVFDDLFEDVFDFADTLIDPFGLVSDEQVDEAFGDLPDVLDPGGIFHETKEGANILDPFGFIERDIGNVGDWWDDTVGNTAKREEARAARQLLDNEAAERRRIAQEKKDKDFADVLSAANAGLSARNAAFTDENFANTKKGGQRHSGSSIFEEEDLLGL
jgi:hypothetical protein